MTKFLIRGLEMRRKIPSLRGNSSTIYLPKSWAGKKVAVILLDGKHGGTLDGEEEEDRG
jgi:hypothetical protein